MFFSDGVHTLDARLLNAFPKSKRATQASSFVETAGRLADGASLRPYSPVDSLGAFFRQLDGQGLLYLVPGDKGRRLLTRETCGPLAMSKCPSSVTMVLGGTLGYAPHTADSIADILRAAGAHHTHTLAIGVRQQHASSIVAYLRSMGDDGHLGNACALTFYGGARGTAEVSFELFPQQRRIGQL